MIYITGDTHGTRNFYKLLDNRFKSLTKKDYILICGDCGVLFDPVKSSHMINLYTYLPYTVLFIDGNHENYDMLAEYAVSSWNGGKVQFISDSIIHLMNSSKVQHHGFLISDANNYLEELKKAVHFKHWYFGHYHLDKNYDDVTALYNKILKLKG